MPTIRTGVRLKRFLCHICKNMFIFVQSLEYTQT